jgi:DNA-binding response OmpR family regulator
MGKLLLIEDNINIQDFNKELLEEQGHTVILAFNLKHAWEKWRTNKPDLIVLDVMLPDGSGFDWLEELRETSRVPVLILSAKGELGDRKMGYGTGADDYLPKPYLEDDLVMKIAAILKRAEQVPERITRGRLSLDVQSRRAYIDEADLGLTPKDYDLLQYFDQNKNRLISAEELYESVRGMSMIGDNRAIKVAVSRLRIKLEGSGYTIIFNKEQNGYCFEKSK